MTKKQVRELFDECYPRETFLGPHGRNGRMVIDDVMRREAWNDFVDSLNKDRKVSDHQAFTWSNPF